METAIAFAAGMLLTLIALALEDWTRLSKQSNASPLNEEKYGAAKMFCRTGERDPASGSPGWAYIARTKTSKLLHGWSRKVWSRSLQNCLVQFVSDGAERVVYAASTITHPSNSGKRN
jgi:hypothetical protein